jgi:hypothetical protein
MRARHIRFSCNGESTSLSAAIVAAAQHYNAELNVLEGNVRPGE